MKYKYLATTALAVVLWATPAKSLTISGDTNLNELYPNGTIKETLASVDGYIATLTTQNIDINSSGTGISANNPNSQIILGNENTEKLNVSAPTNMASFANNGGKIALTGQTINLNSKSYTVVSQFEESNVTANADKIIIASTEKMGAYATRGGKMTLNADKIDITAQLAGITAQANNSQISLKGTDINIFSQTDNAVLALGSGGNADTATPGLINIEGTNVNISTNSDIWGAVHAGNNTTQTTNPVSTVNITAENINISAPNSYALAAMSQGVIKLEGNTVLTSKEEAISTRGGAQVIINKSGNYTTKIDGNINFNYDKNTSGTAIDAIVDITLVGPDSYWNGNTIVGYSHLPETEKLQVNQATITLKDGAVWNTTPITDNKTQTDGSFYTALNNLNIENGIVNINDTTRGIAVDNISSADATFNGGTLNINKTMSVSNNLTLNNNVAGDGVITLNDGSTLNVTLGKTTIANEINNNGATVNVVLQNKEDSVDLEKIFINYTENNTESADFYKGLNVSLQNALYTFVKDENDNNSSVYFVEAKSSAEVASLLGVTGTAAAAAIAAVSGGSTTTNENFNAVADAINEAAQAGNTAVVKEAEKLGADTNPLIRSRETDLSNMIFTAATDALNDNAGALAEGKSSGDVFHKVTAWVRGLFNSLDHEKTSKAAGFNGDTYGVAFGIDKELDNHIKAGVGYAYSESDIDSALRDTDIDTNTVFVYGKYQPADWYVNTVAAYSWSDYEEKKSVLGYSANAKYDVDTFALQTMYGYETSLNSYDITPEAGLRYMHIAQDSYTDKLGTNISSNDSDILTLVAGAKVAKNFELESGATFRPELKAAVTYDLLEDGNNASVMLANGAAYRVNGEKLDRLGFELGAKVTADVADNWEVSAGYEARLRNDYHDNTWLLQAKYSF